MPEQIGVLITALSGRALAASARRAGYLPLVVDFFGDDDTRAFASDLVRLDGGVERRFERRALMAALDRLAGSRPVAGVVYGAGFEDRPAIIDAIARRWRVIGNGAHTIARLKDPCAFAALCRDCGIAHPEISPEPPGQPRSWISRRRGGAGGGHIRAVDGSARDGGTYYQRKVAGRTISALFIADGRNSRVIGFSEQWVAPGAGQPYRYGGAVRPAALDPASATSIAEAIERVVARAGLVGLNSADFIISREHSWLLEINPRPGATLDLFEPQESEAGTLFAAHLAACDGELHPVCVDSAGRAAAIVYAEHDIRRVPVIDWPDWAADRQPAGSFVARGEPFCTVVADAPDAAQASRLVHARSARILAAATGRAA
ncbi:MAG: ATP-grasp domain-containing protein [Methylobacteriaceae bacterium]|nr:ATP-grasp domain-containing protein [Methylobacteriaceae bacterium]